MPPVSHKTKQHNLNYLTLINNFYFFYQPVRSIIGIVAFYQLFDSILLALIPYIIFELFYITLVTPAMKLVGIIGVKTSLYLFVLTIIISMLPAYAYAITQNTFHLFVWFALSNASLFFYFPAKIYLTNRLTDHKHRGTQVGFMRITYTLTAVISPILAGLITTHYSFTTLIITYSSLILLVAIPISKLDQLYFHTNINIFRWLKKPFAKSLINVNFHSQLAVNTNAIWIIFMFIALSQSYLHLGTVIAFTTAISVLILFFFGKYLNTHNRYRSLKTTYYLNIIPYIAKSIPGIPVVFSNTLAQITATPTIEADEVINYDLMSDHKNVSELDEAVAIREVIIDSCYLFWLLTSTVLVTIFSFQITFLILGFTLLILTFLFKPHSQTSSH